MTAAEWLDRASKRDRLLVWQRGLPLDMPLPDDDGEVALILRAVDREFGGGTISDGPLPSDV